MKDSWLIWRDLQSEPTLKLIYIQFVMLKVSWSGFVIRANTVVSTD
jgi:hypothetical protein